MPEKTAGDMRSSQRPSNLAKRADVPAIHFAEFLRPGQRASKCSALIASACKWNPSASDFHSIGRVEPVGGDDDRRFNNVQPTRAGG